MRLIQSASSIGLQFSLGTSSANRAPTAQSDSGSRRGMSGTVFARGASSDPPRSDIIMAGIEILDLLNVAFVICDRASRLLHSNQSARYILGRGDGVRLDASGRLRTSRPGSPALSDVIRELAEPGPAEHCKTTHLVIAARRPSGKRPLIMCVLKPALLPGESTIPMPAVVPIVFWEHEGHSDADEACLQKIWGLTPAECRFANLLMEGMKLVDCCEHLGICRATGAFHLANLFKKTGARRQIELLSVLFRSVGLTPVGTRAAVVSVPNQISILAAHVPEA